MEHAPACTTVQVPLLVYYIKLKSRLSVHQSAFFNEWISAMAGWIDIILTQNKSYAFWHRQVCFKMFLTDADCHPRHFEQWSARISTENFKCIPVKPQLRQD